VNVPNLEVKPVGPEETATVHAVIHAAFEARPPLDPPAAALTETRQELEERLAGHGGLLARVDGEPAGALVLDPVGSTMYLRRVGVVPAMRHHHVAAALIDAAAEAAEGYDDLTVVAREELPGTIRFWEHQGFREIRRVSPNVELRRPLRTAVFQAPDADATRALGRSVAGQVTAGDLIVLTGSLGAGKTTFTQGLGAGLGVRGAVTSPTFVIARVHPSEVGGPALVHVDAYRLGGIDELDDLDLDTSLDRAVTVVEWGEGLAEGLSESRLEVHLVRDDETDHRRVEITPVGPRWHALSFRGLG
jgi:tRNA threonylcarbamoyladenosine biosynthesis protein TsaE